MPLFGPSIPEERIFMGLERFEAVAPSFLNPKHRLFDLNLISVVVITAIVATTVAHECLLATVGTPPSLITPATSGTISPSPSPSPSGPREPLSLAFSGYTAEGQTDELSAGVIPANATVINATFYWTDDYGNNDDFRLELLVNGTVVGEDEGTTGMLSVSAGGSPNATLSALITAVRCPGVVASSPVDRDNGNSWHMTIEIAFGGQG
jgi:hypothetical protein